MVVALTVKEAEVRVPEGVGCVVLLVGVFEIDVAPPPPQPEARAERDAASPPTITARLRSMNVPCSNLGEGFEPIVLIGEILV
jgi:hypothetical protein